MRRNWVGLALAAIGIGLAVGELSDLVDGEVTPLGVALAIVGFALTVVGLWMAKR